MVQTGEVEALQEARTLIKTRGEEDPVVEDLTETRTGIVIDKISLNKRRTHNDPPFSRM